jgi:hypothetical protein
MFNILSRRSRSNLVALLLHPLFYIALNRFAQAQSLPANRETLLHAGDLALNIEVADHRRGLHIHDGLSSRTIDIPESFTLVLKDKTVLRSTDMQVTWVRDSS